MQQPYAATSSMVGILKNSWELRRAEIMDNSTCLADGAIPLALSEISAFRIQSRTWIRHPDGYRLFVFDVVAFKFIAGCLAP